MNLKNIVIMSYFFLVCSCPVFAVEKSPSPWKGASFSATLKSYHASKPDDIEKGKVYIGKQGIRQESIPAGGTNQNQIDSIFNIGQMKSYLLNKTNKTYFEVPIAKKEDEKNILPGGLFTNKPCEGYKLSKKIGKKQYIKRQIIEWRCESQKSYVTQYYDPVLKSVIREEHENGYVEELQDIVIQRITDKLFKIPANYRKISMQEFFTGIPEFEAYKETGDEGNFEPDKDVDKLPGYKSNIPVRVTCNRYIISGRNSSMKQLYLIFSYIFIALLFVETSFAKDEQYSGPDFTAKKVTMDDGDKTVSQIHMSKTGFREILMTNVPFEIMYISNYKDKKMWMVVPSKKLYSDMASMQGDENSEFTRSTVFDNKPCKGFDKTKKLSTKTINNKKVEEWGCVNKKTKKAILQWFEPKSKMVIREKDKGMGTSDILVSNIKFQSQSKSLFTLPAGYKKVSLNEMLKIMQNQ
jgi:hypothetical protein